MTLSQSPVSLKLLRRMRPRFQQTFLTLHQDAENFAETIASAGQVEGGWLGILKPVVIYADHDCYTTFFSHTRSNLNLVVPV